MTAQENPYPKFLLIGIILIIIIALVVGAYFYFRNNGGPGQTIPPDTSGSTGETGGDVGDRMGSIEAFGQFAVNQSIRAQIFNPANLKRY